MSEVFEPALTQEMIDYMKIKATYDPARMDGFELSLAQKVSHGDLFLNVMDYGAKGDGVTDDTTALLNAIADMKAKNRKLYLPKGTYLFSQTLTLNGYFCIVGESRYNTTLLKNFNGLGISILAQKGYLGSFTLDNKSTNKTTDTGGGISVGDPTHDGTNAIIKDILIQNQGQDGLWVQNADTCNIQVDSYFNKRDGVRLQSTMAGADNVNANVVDCNVMTNGNYGLYVDKAYVNKIHCVTQGNSQYGAYVNAVKNTLDFYTEGNTLGSVNFDTNGFGNFVTGSFIEGQPTNVNDNYMVINTNSFYGFRLGRIAIKKLFRNQYWTATTTIAAGGHYDYVTPSNVYGASTTSQIVMNPPSALPDGIGFYCFSSAADTVTVRFFNYTANPITLNGLQINLSIIVYAE